MMIEICMATYCAEKYLAEQLQSIFNQSDQRFRLLVRDNASTDGTIAILKEFSQKFPGRITIIEGKENLGAKGNFSFLANAAKEQYIMFADADDVWLPFKIEQTFNEMKRIEKKWGKACPLLVHTDLKVVDQNLNLLAESFWRYSRLDPQIAQNLHRQLVQNSVTGCTVMVNRALLDLALPIPPTAKMHDWWLALVAGAFGQISIIKTPTMLYRQHGRNDVGAKNRQGFLAIAKEIKRGMSASSRLDLKEHLVEKYRQAASFLSRYQAMLNSKQILMLEAFVSLEHCSWWNKRWLIFKHQFFENTLIRNAGMLLLI